LGEKWSLLSGSMIRKRPGSCLSVFQTKTLDGPSCCAVSMLSNTKDIEIFRTGAKLSRAIDTQSSEFAKSMKQVVSNQRFHNLLGLKTT